MMMKPITVLTAARAVNAAAALPVATGRASALSRLLTHPRRIAQTLDWHQSKQGLVNIYNYNDSHSQNNCTSSVLNLSLARDRIDLAVASHPAAESATAAAAVQPLPSIPLTSTASSSSSSSSSTLSNNVNAATAIGQELQQLIQQFGVCALLVHWPLQPESGACGAACGRVLYFLDALCAQECIQQPIGLWNGPPPPPLPFMDKWGRSQGFCSSSSLFSSSSMDYSWSSSDPDAVPPTVSALEMWNGFCRTYWPKYGVEEAKKRSVDTVALSTATAATATLFRSHKQSPPPLLVSPHRIATLQ